MKDEEIWTDSPEDAEFKNRVLSLPDDEPGPRLSRRVYAALEAEAQHLERCTAQPPLPRRQTPFWQPAWQFAATLVLLGLGFAGGYFYQAPLRQAIQEVQRESDAVRSDLSRVMMDRSAAGDRLAGIRQCAQLEGADDDLVRRLLDLIAGDDNTQVRLAAVDALYLFGDRPMVREAVQAALPRQTSPLVQVAIMDLLVAWRDKQAVSSLRTLTEQGQFDPLVQQGARESIEKLL